MKIPVMGGVKEGWLKRIALGSVALAVLPLQFLSPLQVEVAQSQTWQTSYVLADRAPELLADATPEVKIEKTVSRYQEEENKRAAQKRAQESVATNAAPCRELNESEKRDLIERASAAYGIPYSLLYTIWDLESGERSCTQKVVRIVNGQKTMGALVSSAGATGPFQFMPGTWRAYGVDGNGDGVKNIHDASDAAFAAAKLLAANGANRGDFARAAFAYNRADWYVDKVLTRANLK